MDSRAQVLAAIQGFSEQGLAPTLKRVAGADPAANAEIADTVPANKYWKLLAVSVALVQGATQTPLPNLVISDASDNVLAQIPGLSSALNASLTAQLSWAQDLPVSGGGAVVVGTGPLPGGLVLPGGYKIKTVTTGIGANTNYGVPSYFVIEYA